MTFAAVVGARPLDEAPLLEAVDPIRDRAGGDHRLTHQIAGGELVRPLTAIVEGPPPALAGRDVAGFAYLSLVGTALAFVLWFNGIRRLPAAAPSLLGLATPVTGAVLGQSLSPLKLTGFVVTLTAVAYGASLRGSAPAAAPGEPGARRRGDVVPPTSPAPVSSRAWDPVE